jgi:hypothetical protein
MKRNAASGEQRILSLNDVDVQKSIVYSVLLV